MRAIPRSGERVPAVGLGTARAFSLTGLGIRPERSVAPAASFPEAQLAPLREVLRLFHAHGGRVVDTAAAYGTAEALVGQFGQELKITEDLFITTKVLAEGREAGIQQMRASAQRLGKTPIDALLIHNLHDWRTQYRTLRQWQEQGRIRYIGISYAQTVGHEQVEEVLKAERFDLFQINYNALDTNAERRLLPLALEKGLAVQVNVPFGNAELFRRVRGHTLPEWAAEFGASTWAQFFLKFILGHPAVTCVLPATHDPHHVVDNTRAMYGPMPDRAQRKQMVAYLSSL